MIVMKMMGGLGNQMFQYAFSRELAWLNHDDVVYDLDSYSTDKQRQLEIYSFNVPALTDWKTVFTKKEQEKIIREQKIYRVIQRGMRFLHNSDRVGEGIYRCYQKKGRYYNFDPYYYSVQECSDKIKVAYGYFQGEKYFEHVIDEVRTSFRITKPILEEKNVLKQIESTNSICIHMRFGDYKKIKNRRFNVITPEYFQKGIEYIKAHIETPVFFVFTNDESAARNYICGDNAVFVKGLKTYQDFRLMVSCQHFIISNSTFSWWASYLSNNPQKTIIVPEKWRRNQENDPALMESNGIDYVRI